MRIAAIQMASGPSVNANLTEAAWLIGRAARAGARLVVLPENFALMPMRDADREAIVEPDSGGPLQAFLAQQAKARGIWLVGGTLPLQTGATGKAAAACLVFNDRGERIGRYDKMHLFDVSLENGERYQESNSFQAGERVTVVDTPLGRLGLAVCYDLRFPELFRAMLDEGAELFAVPSAFTAVTGKAHWEVLVRARSIENTAYAIAAAQGGYHLNGRETWGDSMIVDPWGEVLDRLPRGSGVVVAEWNRERQERVRASLPSINHRRIYADRHATRG
jgi:predicted amidohydrolase